MKTYEDSGFRYFYDYHIKLWTLLTIDSEGNQVGNVQYFVNKTQLILNYPQLSFGKTH